MKLLLTATAMLSFTFALAACVPAQSVETSESSAAIPTNASTPTTGPRALFQSVRSDGLEEMIVAGGCFWCVEADFEKLGGVLEAVSGYTGGRTENPSYKSVSYTETGHYEAVEVTYDSAVVNYTQLLDYFWRHIDVTDPNGQFCDKGSSYRTAVFANEDQIEIAEQSKNDIAVSKPFDGPVVTEILPLGTFYVAEDYHQDYYKTNPVRYARYRIGCRRDARLEQLWGPAKSNGSGK